MVEGRLNDNRDTRLPGSELQGLRSQELRSCYVWMKEAWKRYGGFEESHEQCGEPVILEQLLVSLCGDGTFGRNPKPQTCSCLNMF